MPSSSDDVEQLRQDHPGAAAHLPPHAGRKPRVPEDANPQHWRVGRTQPHNLYRGGVHVAVALGAPADAAALAADVVTALRARQAQDTPSDPAAPLPYLLAVVGKDTLPDPDGLVATWSGGDVDEAESYARDHGHEVVPLYLRAPGAVAAAPTEDGQRRTRGLLRSAWLESEDWRSQAERLARLLVRDRVALARVKAQRDASDRSLLELVPPAPCAGENEAAVERTDPVLGYYARLRAMEPSDELLVQIEAGELVRQRELAAAHDPGTQDGES